MTSAGRRTAWSKWPAASKNRGGGAGAVSLTLGCYLLAAVILTWQLWRDPASRIVAGNPTDADLFAWFFRYDAMAVAHASLPGLTTSALNAPTGINLMWNTSMPLPGILLAPATILFGPQVSLTVLMTAGFAGSAASMLYVLRRWDVSLTAAALAGAVYGFSPALVQSAIGHYNLQFAVLAPLIADAALRLGTGSAAPLRGGIRLGLLAAAQLFTGEELLLASTLTGVVLLAGLALARPGDALRRLRPAAAGLAVAIGILAVLAGVPLWIQFAGPLTQHGSAFAPDFFKNDLSGFVTPSRYLLFHTRGSAAAAAAFPGGAPEYLAYLGWPLLVVALAAAVALWRRPPVFATALTAAVLELLSLGGHLLADGTVHQGIALPWRWLEGLPVIGLALPDRFSLLADGAVAALLAFALDALRDRARKPGSARLVTAAAVLAVLPLVPLPLPAVAATPLPSGWSAALSALRLPAGARVLTVPVPTPNLTAPMRWQATSGAPVSLIGGYFQGPAWNGHAYVGGNGPRATARYLDSLWSGAPAVAKPTRSQVQGDLSYWQPAAVVADAVGHPELARYLTGIFGRPALVSGQLLVWRMRLPGGRRP